MRKLLSFVFGGAFFFFSVGPLLYADIIISTDTAWPAVPSPRIINDIVRIQNGAVLTIPSGIILKFQQETGIVVENGALRAQRVLFTSIKDLTTGLTPRPGDWGGITYLSKNKVSETLLDDCKFFYAGGTSINFTGGALNIKHENSGSQTALLTINKCSFQNNKAGISLESITPCVIQNSTFAFNGMAITSGAFSANGGALIRGNVFENNIAGIHVSGQVAEISNNKFISNQQPIYIYSQGAPLISNNKFSSNTKTLANIVPGVSLREFDTSTILSAGGLDGIEIINTFSLTIPWTLDVKNFPYIMRSRLNIQPSGGLTINPGVAVKLSDSGEIINSGLFHVLGTESEPVIFTSLYDNSVKGNTHLGYNPSSQPNIGDWKGIQGGDHVIIQNALLRYGAGTNFYVSEPYLLLIGNNGNICNSTFEKSNTAIRYVGSSSMLIEGCTIQNNILGINGSDSVAPAQIKNNRFHLNQKALLVKNNVSEVSDNTFTQNSNFCINISSGSGNPFLSQNRFGDNQGFLLYIHPAVHFQDFDSSIILSPNKIEGIIVSGTLTSHETWSSWKFPYLINGVSLNAGSRLILQPGTVVKYFLNQSMNILGSLEANGTQAAPIYFTSYKDDSIGGDTNIYEGPLASPSLGNWVGLTVNSPGKINFNNTYFRFSQQTVKIDSNEPSFISNSNFSNSQIGIYFPPSQNRKTVTISSCTFHQNSYSGVIQEDSVPNNDILISNSLFQKNGVALQIVNAGIRSIDNTFLSNARSIDATGVGTVLILRNSFGNNNSALVRIGGNIQLSGLETSTIISTNSIHAIELMYSGTTGVTTLSPIVWPYYLNNFFIPATGKLSINPGVILKLKGHFLANGELIVNGDENNPVIFTSYKDDLIGGNSNVSEGNVTPQKGDWNGIKLFKPSQISNAIFQYADKSIYSATSSSFTVKNTSFQFVNDGIYLETFHSSSSARYCYFGQATHGVRNTTLQNFDARFNDWNNVSGPADLSDDTNTHGWYNPQGQGVLVSNKVNYIPWLGNQNNELTLPSLQIEEAPVTPSQVVNLQLHVEGDASDM
ncbi:MAG: right-handed parallel beta-helix repeat-containing protein, partial [Elusimicrobiota bacterium]